MTTGGYCGFLSEFIGLMHSESALEDAGFDCNSYDVVRRYDKETFETLVGEEDYFADLFGRLCLHSVAECGRRGLQDFLMWPARLGRTLGNAAMRAATSKEFVADSAISKRYFDHPGKNAL